MKIYTKTGDDGTTGLQGGTRVPKSNQRIIAYGTVDETNSILGLVASHIQDKEIQSILIKLQNDLFVAGADLSNPNTDDSAQRVTEQMISYIEKEIDSIEAQLDSLTRFILPGGSTIAALFHLARSVARRAETQIVILEESENVNPLCKTYMNRLSDLLFVLARLANKKSNIADVPWDL